MKVQILQEFDGYPNGDDKGPVTFKPGAEPVEVEDAFGEMIVGKGLAKAVDAPAGGPAREPAAGDA